MFLQNNFYIVDCLFIDFWFFNTNLNILHYSEKVDLLLQLTNSKLQREWSELFLPWSLIAAQLTNGWKNKIHKNNTPCFLSGHFYQLFPSKRSQNGIKTFHNEHFIELVFSRNISSNFCIIISMKWLHVYFWVYLKFLCKFWGKKL